MMRWRLLEIGNWLLRRAGLKLVTVPSLNDTPAEFIEKYERELKRLKRSSNKVVFRHFYHREGNHPEDHVDFQCVFTTRHLARLNGSILDVGSYRHFILGLLSSRAVTTVDIRPRQVTIDNERLIVADARDLSVIPDQSFDVVSTLCTVEHIGLGQYGDVIDEQADGTAVREFIRVLKPGGHLIITTTINRLHSIIAFNAHRIYTYQEIHNLCQGLKLKCEELFSRKLGRQCQLGEITDERHAEAWDVYCGLWQK